MLENYSELTEELYKEFLDFYGAKVPNPEHNPIQFEFLIKTFLYYKKRMN